MPRRLLGRTTVLPVARASATAALTPPRHGSPWPKPITAASTLSSRSIDASACALEAANAAGISCTPLAAGQRVARAQHVADEQRLVALEVQRDAAVGVAGRVHHARAAGHVEAVAGAERLHLGDAHAARPAGAARAPPSAARPRGSAGTGRTEPSRLPPVCVRASCSSAAWTSTGTPCSLRSRSAKPTWSECAWVSTSARMSPQSWPELAAGSPRACRRTRGCRRRPPSAPVASSTR